MLRVPLDLAGILPPVATPFVDDEVDLAAMRANCERWMRTGLRGVLLLGTNGEAPLIRDEEAVRLVAAAREAVPEDRVLLVGTGRQATRDVIALSRAVAREGADAVLVLTPSVYRNSAHARALVAHYRAIADGSPVPVLLYNMPQATGVTLTPAMVQELASHPNIAGIKESSGDVAVVGDLVGRVTSGFPVVVGARALALRQPDGRRHRRHRRHRQRLPRAVRPPLRPDPRRPSRGSARPAARDDPARGGGHHRASACRASRRRWRWPATARASPAARSFRSTRRIAGRSAASSRRCPPGRKP